MPGPRILILIALLSASLAVSAETAAVPNPGFELVLPGQAAARLGEAELAALPRVEVTGASHEEPPSVWSGVALVDLLAKAGVPVGKEFRGAQLARVVRVTAEDGYQVVFSLGELNQGFGNGKVLLVTRRDGKPLAEDGPFRLVVPGDARAGRWLRNLARIEVIDLATPGAAPDH